MYQQLMIHFLSNRLFYVILRYRWFDVFVLNVHRPDEGRCDDKRTALTGLADLTTGFSRTPFHTVS
jgi:hypothetical protein